MNAWERTQSWVDLVAHAINCTQTSHVPKQWEWESIYFKIFLAHRIAIAFTDECFRGIASY